MKEYRRQPMRERQSCAAMLDAHLVTIQASTLALRRLLQAYGLPSDSENILERIMDATAAAEHALLALERCLKVALRRRTAAAARRLLQADGLPSDFGDTLARIEAATDAAEHALLALEHCLEVALRGCTAAAVRRLSATQTQKTPAGTGAISKTTRAGDANEHSK